MRRTRHGWWQWRWEATGAELEKICRGLRGVLASVDPRDGGERAERWVRHRTTDGGMVRLEAQLHPDEAAMVLKALAEARRQSTDVPAETDCSAPPPQVKPDSGARKADALVSIARDRTCRFPGCTSACFVDAHHVEHWALGGETKLSNLLKLCRTHHTAVHEGGFRVDNEGGTFTFYAPDGRLLPLVPDAPGVPAETLAALRARHAAAGLQIDPEIQLGPFRLEAIDYDLAVAALLPGSATSSVSR